MTKKYNQSYKKCSAIEPCIKQSSRKKKGKEIRLHIVTWNILNYLHMASKRLHHFPSADGLTCLSKYAILSTYLSAVTDHPHIADQNCTNDARHTQILRHRSSALFAYASYACVQAHTHGPKAGRNQILSTQYDCSGQTKEVSFVVA